jgi:hypothetical protein
MKHIILAIALGLLPASLHAEKASTAQDASPEQDLDCAIFFALVGGKSEGSRQAGVIAAMSYFIGRFEVVSEIDFSTAAAEHLELASLAEIIAESDDCISRMEAFSVRLNEFGDAFKGLQSELDNADSSGE